MLQPRRQKFRKSHKGRIRGLARRGSEIAFGDFGLQATTNGRITARQIEAARIAMTRFVRRQGKVWIRIFPHTPVTARPAETRMGKGKGSVEFYVAAINAGRVLYEIQGVPEATAREAFRLAASKLPVQTRFLKRDEVLL